MANFNLLVIAGNLTRDPEIRQVGESNVANFTIAETARFKSQGEQREDVCFLDCKAWNATADLVAQHCHKGQNVLLSGRLQMEQWTDKEGNKRSRHVLKVDKLQFLGPPRRSEGAEGHEPAPESRRPRSQHAPADDEPPF